MKNAKRAPQGRPSRLRIGRGYFAESWMPRAATATAARDAM